MAVLNHPLAAVVETLPLQPGVYRFLNAQGAFLYIGKAKVLRHRVASYFNHAQQEMPARLQAMLSHARQLEITVTASEIDALLLEAAMIRRHKPPYNVLLKDGKSYPYLHLTTDGPFPSIALYWGNRQSGGRFFGPYPSTAAVQATLKQLQQAFPLRQCADVEFANRTRPCLQYQIGRCHAPCCQKITPEQYAPLVQEVILFLEGKDQQLLSQLQTTMWQAAARMEYEQAAVLRDRIKAITHVQAKRRINLSSPHADLDLVAMICQNGLTAVQVFFIRAGINLGNRLFFPQTPIDQPWSARDILQSFLEQFYIDKIPPAEILINHPLADPDGWLHTFLQQRRGSAVELRVPLRGEKQQLLQMAILNAQMAIDRRLASQEIWQERLQRLATRFQMAVIPKRIEVYDISHSQGEAPVGAMIVCGATGFIKSEYRHFAIRDPLLSDDTGRMAEMLARRFKNPLAVWPDLVLLDGGLGQLHAALRVAAAQQIPPSVRFAAIAKGTSLQETGRERIFLPEQADPLHLTEHDPLLFFLQTIRDEAHRCAIRAHRSQRDKQRTTSLLDQIPGIGPKRKKALLHHFGSVRNIKSAGVEEIIQSGILPRPLAERMHEFL